MIYSVFSSLNDPPNPHLNSISNAENQVFTPNSDIFYFSNSENLKNYSSDYKQA